MDIFGPPQNPYLDGTTGIIRTPPAPHRGGGGTPAEFKANLKRKVKCIRNADTYDRVVIAATRRRLKATTGATSTHGSMTSTRNGKPRTTPAAAPRPAASPASCQTCGKLVDNDPGYYTVAKLKEWKASPEEDARRRMETRGAPSTPRRHPAKGRRPTLFSEAAEEVASYRTH
jgi:hypothetical protein